MRSNTDQFNKESLLSQSLANKIKLSRMLRSQLKESINWVGGNVLLHISAAIAAIDDEIDDFQMTDAEEVYLPDSQSSQRDMRQILEASMMQRKACPMEHQCTGAPCAHRPLCDEAKSAGID